MKKYLLLIHSLFLAVCSFGQTEIKAVKADENMEHVFTTKDLYRYPQYQLGRVEFRDGSAAEARLNYHKYFNQLMFIDANGDSLALANPETIRVIVIGIDSFYYFKEMYVEQVASYKNSIIGRRQLLKIVDEKKSGAYGSSYTNNSTTTDKIYYTVDGTPRLNVGESTLFAQTAEYYISYKKNEFVPLIKKNIEKLYSSQSKEIRDYIKENNTDFTNEESLKKLMEFVER
jgi:hypothetical protein